MAVVGGLPRLTVFSLWSQITDAGLEQLANSPQLRELTLHYCIEVTDAGLAHFARLTRLEKLTLGNCDPITEAGLAHLAGLPRLHTLDIHLRNQRYDPRLAHMSNADARELTEKLTTYWDEDLAPLGKLPNLRQLSLGAHGITDRGLEILAGFPSLQTLVLRVRMVSDEGVAALRAARPDLKIVFE
jgi:hypothetical protein